MTVNGSITSDVTVNSAATLGGSGTTGSVTVKPGGKVVPGDPQILTVDGNYEQDATATLHLDIAGTTSGDFDQLVVSGNATLSPDSVLEVNFIGGFAPKQGDTFDLIVAASV
ncbi:MAG: autotransporter outer membrane beta-barrel domain-containing protein, partial [Chthoniobacterales bacterium]